MLIREAIKESFMGSEINFRKVYYLVNNILPNELEYSFKDDVTLNLETITEKELRKAYPRAIIFRRDTITGESEEDLSSLRMGIVSRFIAILDEDVYYLVFPYAINILYVGDKGNTLVEEFLKIIKPENIAPKKANIGLIAFNSGDYYIMDSQIESTVTDIDLNYNDDFKKTHEDIVAFLGRKKSGIILLHGLQGSGKTYYIRHLISNYPGKYLFITPSMASRLGEPDFVAFLLSNKDAIFILEDCDQVIRERSMDYFNGAIVSILNMSDGILSDVFNFKFICTFNSDILTVDKALLRAGRCYANYEFGLLNKDKTEKLLKARGFDPKECTAMSLADIYAYSEENRVKTNKKRIGF